MEIANYYLTTLLQAAKNLGPVIGFIIGGYLIFIKLPFLFFRKSMEEQKAKSVQEERVIPKEIPQNRQEKSKTKSQESEKKAPPHKKTKIKIKVVTPEEVLGFPKEATPTSEELKKRYFELLKKNHPDRVAMMGDEFKTLAEKNTKQINEAYEKLKKKAA